MSHCNLCFTFIALLLHLFITSTLPLDRFHGAKWRYALLFRAPNTFGVAQNQANI
jgi:hypothetical protein